MAVCAIRPLLMPMHGRSRTVLTVLAIVVALGLLAVPVECSLAAGPHSLFADPAASADDDHRSNHHRAHRSLDSVAPRQRPATDHPIRSVGVDALALPAASDEGQRNVPSLNAMTTPAEGTSSTAADVVTEPVPKVALASRTSDDPSPLSGRLVPGPEPPPP